MAALFATNGVFFSDDELSVLLSIFGAGRKVNYVRLLESLGIELSWEQQMEVYPNNDLPRDAATITIKAGSSKERKGLTVKEMTRSASSLREFRFDHKQMHEDVLQPIRDKWRTILEVFKAKDKQDWGFIHQTTFMRILRVAGTLKGLSDEDFLYLFVVREGLRDKRGFINYHQFGDKHC